MRRLAALALFLALVAAAACGGGDGDGGSSASPGASQSEGSGGSATATRTGGVSQPLNVPPDGGPVPLNPGAYHTTRFAPSAYFAVGEGWSAQFDNERYFSVFQRTEASGRFINLLSPDGVFDPATGGREDLPGTPDDLTAWIAAHPALETSNPSSLQVGLLSGRQLEVTLADADASGPLELLAAGGLNSQAIAPGQKLHIVVLDYRGAPLVIVLGAPSAEFGEFFSQAEAVIGSLTFAD